MSNCSLKEGMIKRLWVIDIPLHFRNQFIDLVLKWKDCSGEEWTIKRLKSLKVDLFRAKAGLPPLTWVRKNRDGKWHGVIGQLFNYASRSEKNFRKIVQTLMCYTVFTYREATPAQVKKFTTALRAAPPRISGEWLQSFTKTCRHTRQCSVDRRTDVSILLFRGSPSKRKPSRGFRSVAQDSNILDDVFLFEKDWGQTLLHHFPDLYGRVLEGVNHDPIRPPWYGDRPVMDPLQVFGGKIGFIQEPGGKLRSVASPFLVHQRALQHFGDALYALAYRLPWDCTHDQSLPVPILQDRLKSGKTVHSVDLSSATDYFPLEVQLAALRAVFGNIPDIDLFEVISRSQWTSPCGVIRWCRGQPLGLYPSFAAFTVCHGLLLKHLNNGKWNQKFYVLGDDVVILDDKLHQRYVETLESWSCPHSPEKSISSNQICEFAGNVITSKSVTPQYKWREMSNKNFIDICRQMGKRSRILLTQKQREVFDLIKHCTMPKGLNFSYPGSSWASMDSLTSDTFGKGMEKAVDSLVDLAPLLNKNLYGSNIKKSEYSFSETTASQQYLLKKTETFDEKVCGVLRKILPWFTKNQKYNLSSVPASVGKPNRLPLAVKQPSLITALDRYRKELKLDP